MQNELRYQVRSREIVDLVSAMRSSRLTLTAYFQRNLVWRDAHKRDFIDTILKGYPFPQIFLARGPIDLITMSASQCVVDGQQRLSTISDFVSGKLDVDGKYFSDLSPKEKEEFLKYEVAVIDFDLDAGDSRLKEIFHRLNRTYYSLSSVEKIASEYSASEFMLVARVLCGEISANAEDSEDENFDETEEGGDQFENRFVRDPGIDADSWGWMLNHADGEYAELIRTKEIFTKLEFDRKVPLMFTLSIMCTFLAGYFNRNDKVRRYLEDRNGHFPEKEEVVETLNNTAIVITKLNLPSNSMWWSKANFFSLFCELARNSAYRALAPDLLQKRLTTFSEQVPSDYALAAREATGRKRERDLRSRTLREAVFEVSPSN